MLFENTFHPYRLSQLLSVASTLKSDEAHDLGLPDFPMESLLAITKIMVPWNYTVISYIFRCNGIPCILSSIFNMAMLSSCIRSSVSGTVFGQYNCGVNCVMLYCNWCCAEILRISKFERNYQYCLVVKLCFYL